MRDICSGGGYIKSGIASYDGTAWTTCIETFPEWPLMAFDIAIDENNVKWFATYKGIMSYDDMVETSVTQKNRVPYTLSIPGNYPNPFNPSTTIKYTVPLSGFTDLIIYNVLGQQVRKLISETIPAGTYTVVWNGNDDNGVPVSSGVYFSRLKSGELISIQKMMLFK